MRSKNIFFFIYAIAGSVIGTLINYGFARFFVKSFNISVKIEQKKRKFIYPMLILTLIDIYGAAISFMWNM